MKTRNWQESSNARRESRQSKPVAEVPRPAPAKKDTKRWCGGKVGREHKPECFDYGQLKSPERVGLTGVTGLYKGWKVLACTVCGKELKHHMPFGRERRTNPPEWAQ
jgi:hypothetical protein